jgi:hypothetical protein
MTTRKELENLIAQCPDTTDSSRWTVDQKRAVKRLYDCWLDVQNEECRALLRPLFNWTTGEFVGFKETQA